MIPLYRLDTNTVSYIVKGRLPAARMRLAALSAGQAACISAITEAELLYGMAKSASGEQRRRALEWFLARLQIHPLGRDAAAAYGPLRAKQELLGKTLGPLDLQIAAHAIALQAVVVTNYRAFWQIPDLAGVENWATDL